MEPLAPVPPGLSTESTIARDANGRWFDDGVPIENEAIARAFDRWLTRAPDGRWVLKNAVNWVYVRIEGAPFFVVAFDFEAMALTLSDGTTAVLDPSTLRQDPEGRLYCQIRGETARFERQPLMALMPVLQEDDEGLYLELQGSRVRLPVVDDALRNPNQSA